MASLKSGDILDGKYRILREIGEGGMGTVYRARQLTLGRDVAIKVPREDLAPEQLARFEREALTIASLGHDNIVHIYECQTKGAIKYIAMEFVEGVDLVKLINNPPEKFTVRDVATLVRSCWLGLGFIHLNGIIHRDIKPSNIMAQRLRDDSWQVKIMDFGLVRSWSSDPMDVTETRLTRDGMVIGTPLYMPPEQLQGARVTKASDIFSMACVAFFALTRHNAYTGKVFDRINTQALKNLPSVLAHAPALPEEVDRIVRSCLVSDPMIRPVDASNVGNEIFHLLTPLFNVPMEEIWSGKGVVAVPPTPTAPKTPSTAKVKTAGSEATTVVVTPDSTDTVPQVTGKSRRGLVASIIAAAALVLVAYASMPLVKRTSESLLPAVVEPAKHSTVLIGGDSPSAAPPEFPDATPVPEGPIAANTATATPGIEATPTISGDDAAREPAARTLRDRYAAMLKKIDIEARGLVGASGNGTRPWIAGRLVDRTASALPELERYLVSGDRHLERGTYAGAESLFKDGSARAEQLLALLAAGPALEQSRRGAEQAREAAAARMASLPEGSPSHPQSRSAEGRFAAGDELFELGDSQAAVGAYAEAARGWQNAQEAIDRINSARATIDSNQAEAAVTFAARCWLPVTEAVDAAHARIAEGDWEGAQLLMDEAQRLSATIFERLNVAVALRERARAALATRLDSFLAGNSAIEQVDAVLLALDNGDQRIESGNIEHALDAWRRVAE